MSSDPSIELMNDLLDICEGVIKGRIAPADGFKKIEDHHDRDPSTPSMLLDVLAMVDLEVKDDENQKKLFTELAKLAMNDVVPEECVRAELECFDAGLQANRMQIIRTKTKLFFKQSKFNLLREETEGYSKLVTELLSVDDTLPASTIAQRMLSLIGTFSLDPNRALDILLEAFERLPSRRSSFVEILKEMQTTAEYLQTFLVWKFTLYQTDKSATPFSLYRLAAALIEEQLVEQDDIVKYLAPTSSDLMESHKARAALASVRSKKAETIIASNVAIDPHKHSSVGQDGQELAQITGISFAAVTGVQEAEDAKLRGDDERMLGCNQKVGLVTALLEDGQWERAKRITDCMPEHYAVQASKRAACAIADMVDSTISDLFHLKCAQGLADADRRKENGAGKWDRTVSCWDDFDVVFELLAAVGPRVAYRSRTLTKLVRLCGSFFEERAVGAYGTGPEISNKMMDLIDEILLPGLSLSESNVALSEEIWGLISQFPYEQRYRLYGRWKTVHTTRHPELTIERGKTIGRTKYVIKRLSKDTVKMMGRILGKLAHTHPSFVFDYLLGQVQTFDNLIHPVVDALRFLTNLELDVLLFCVLEQLASPSKESLKASDGTTSSWLISLATMVGALLKKYTIELAPVLDYVSMQLRNNKSADLLILNEMLHSMAGIEKAAQATQEHIEALSGGELLRQEAGSYGSSIRNKKAAVRLRDAILKEDLAVGLSILVAQQRDAILYQGSKEMPLKLTGEMADQCRDTLVQFSSFLLENMKAEEYARKMPPIDSLLSEYSLPVDAAFFLARPAFRYEVQSVFDAKKKEMRAKEKKEKEREAARREEEREEGEEKEKEKDKKERRQMDAMLKMLMYNEAIDEVVTRLGERLEPLLKKMIRAEISAKTYVLFWMLESYDLEVPSGAYDREVERIRKAIVAVGDSAELGKTKRAREEERLRALEYKLKEEHSRQTDHVARVKAYLLAERENLFKNTPNAILSLLHTCILPRAMFGESDAIFAAKFVLLMHTQRTIGFQTLFFTDKVMCDILPVVSLLSENEAHSLGRCLQLILSQHAAWHEDAAAYEKECTGTPGFQLRLKKPAGKEEQQPAKPMAGEHAQHNMHAKLLHKWQSRVGRSLQGALNNAAAEYVHLRNCIVVATKLLPCFPLMKHDAEGMEKAAAGVRDREKGRRDDLSLKAASYVVLLKTRKLQLRDSAYFGCKGPPPAPKVAAAPAKAAAAPASATKAKAKAAAPAASAAAAAAASAAAAAAAGAAKNGVKRSVAPSAAAAAGEEKRERAVKKEPEVKPEPAEVEGPSLPPALAAGAPAGGEEREEKGGGRVAKKTSTEKATEGAAERPKKRREIELGGVAARTLQLATGANKRPRNELDAVVKKDEARNGSARKEEEQRRGESTLASRFKRETKKEEDEGEDGEVPPSPVKREDDRPTRGSNGAEKEREREREKEREARRVEKGDREERKLREEMKVKLREREEREKEKAKRLAALATSGDEKLPPARVDREKERERERDKRKNNTTAEEPLSKKPRKDKDERKERDSREDSKSRRHSQSRDDKPPSAREKEKERGGERGEKERPGKDRGADRRSKEGRERPKSPAERSKGPSKHKKIEF